MTRKKTAPKPRRDDAAPAPALRQGFLPDLIGYQIRRAHARMRRDFNQSTADLHLGFRPGQVSAMVLIIENPGLIQIELARELDVDKATVVSLVDNLEKAGLVRRQRSSKDRRKQALLPTRAGVRMVQELRRLTEEHEAHFREKFRDGELRQFLEFLQRIYQGNGT